MSLLQDFDRVYVVTRRKTNIYNSILDIHRQLEVVADSAAELAFKISISFYQKPHKSSKAAGRAYIELLRMKEAIKGKTQEDIGALVNKEVVDSVYLELSKEIGWEHFIKELCKDPYVFLEKRNGKRRTRCVLAELLNELAFVALKNIWAQYNIK